MNMPRIYYQKKHTDASASGELWILDKVKPFLADAYKMEA